MLRSACFTVTLAELGSAAQTALKQKANAARIVVAIRPRNPVDGVEAFMVISWTVQALQKRYTPQSGGA